MVKMEVEVGVGVGKGVGMGMEVGVGVGWVTHVHKQISNQHTNEHPLILM